MNYYELNGTSIREGFICFDAENPHIYEAFEKQVLRAIENGHKKVSAKLILNWIRWNEFVKSTDKNFRVNDAYQAYYARKFAEKHPQYAEYFEFRKLRNEDPAPYMRVESDGQLAFL